MLEPGRTLTLAEKGGAGAEVVTAAPGFRLVATMNPGGDYGKKELSPALSNRFTQVPAVVYVSSVHGTAWRALDCSVIASLWCQPSFVSSACMGLLGGQLSCSSIAPHQMPVSWLCAHEWLASKAGSSLSQGFSLVPQLLLCL